MGEAKRRNSGPQQGPPSRPTPDGRMVEYDSPEVAALLEPGQPVSVWLVGAARIIIEATRLSFDDFMRPEHVGLRLAFQVYDRIRTGEMKSWDCSLCGTQGKGTQGVSCLAVVHKTLDEGIKGKPALVLPICHRCDSVSTEETRRRVHQYFSNYGLQRLQEGRA